MSDRLFSRVSDFFSTTVEKEVYKYLPLAGKFYTSKGELSLEINPEHSSLLTQVKKPSLTYRDHELYLVKEAYNYDLKMEGRVSETIKTTYTPVLYGYYTHGGVTFFSPEKLSSIKCFTSMSPISLARLLSLFNEVKHAGSEAINKTYCVSTSVGAVSTSSDFSLKSVDGKYTVVFHNDEVKLFEKDYEVENVSLYYPSIGFIKLVRFIANGRAVFGFFPEYANVLPYFFS